MPKSTPLFFLWRSGGHDSIESWVRDAPEEVRALRQAVLVVSSFIYRRIQCKLSEYPWPLMALADAQLPNHERQDLVASFFATNVCCVPPGLARRMREGSEQELLGPRWRHVWHWIATVMSFNAADVEWRHGRNRARSHAHGQSSVAQFTARAVNAESKAVHCVMRGMASGMKRRAASAREKGQVAAERAAVPNKFKQGSFLRAPTAVDLFKEERRNAKAVGNVRYNPASSDFHAEMKEQWAQLSDECRARYSQRAAELRTVAAANRAEKKRNDNMQKQRALKELDAHIGISSGQAVVPQNVPPSSPQSAGSQALMIVPNNRACGCGKEYKDHRNVADQGLMAMQNAALVAAGVQSPETVSYTLQSAAAWISEAHPNASNDDPSYPLGTSVVRAFMEKKKTMRSYAEVRSSA